MMDVPVPSRPSVFVRGWSAPVILAVLVSAHIAAEPSPIRFENVVQSSGVAWVLNQFPTGDKQMIETMAGGLAVFDYDGDGLSDIFFTNGAPLPGLTKTGPDSWNRLYRNEGELHFTDATERAGLAGAGYSTGAAAGDFDNDGHVDLFVAGVHGNRLYRNDGQGHFVDVTAASGIKDFTWSVAAGWFDYDNDGWLDLFVVNYVDWAPDRNKYCGDISRNLRVYCHPRHYQGLPNALYRNRHDGTFEDVSARSGIGRAIGKGMSVAFADYDDDGFMDAFVTNDGEPDFLFHNRHDGTFEEVGLLAGVAVPAHGKPVSSMGVDFRDYNNDGRPDLHVTALSGETLPLFRNDSGQMFTDVSYATGLAASAIRWSGWGTALADLDNDGFKDLVTANSHANDRIEQFEAVAYRQPNALFRNVSGRFSDVSDQAGPDFVVARAHRGLAVADLDRDGRLDLVTTVLGERPEILHNVSGGMNAWLALKLVGTSSNRDAIGARVHIGTQWNEVTSSAGYASSSLDGVHFGLGDVRTVDRVEIRWPRGTTQVLTNVAVNRVLTVTEPGRSGKVEEVEK
jgi:hypothetical protein